MPNPKIGEHGKNTQIKKGQVLNPNGRPKKYAFEEGFSEAFKKIANADVPVFAIKKMLSKIDALTLSELEELKEDPSMPYIVHAHIVTRIKAVGKRGTARDLQIMSEMTAAVKAEIGGEGNELPKFKAEELYMQPKDTSKNETSIDDFK